ncbi:NAD-dependent epimerase/dehydratase family protein [Plantibacter sp. YIM 135249]|uniref:NAD-dependent epimerase/dehydratase family protein n=1 Tax=Plantibacter sp. YIM 135249 TaxID=3423918 RepID=UPI003D352CEC
MKYLVTGAAGFIGTETVRQLLQRGATVRGVDMFSDYYDVSLKRANVESNTHDRFEMIEGDLNSLDVSNALDGVDVVLHLAGQPGVRKSWGGDFGVYTRNNVDATQRLLEAARKTASLKRFVYASSSSVYGQAESYPTSEDARPQPFSPYGVTKLAGEHLAALYRQNYGTPVVAFRFFTVYGPRQRPDMAFTRFLTAAIRDEALTVYGTGEQIREFTYVGDIVDALLRAGDAEGELPVVMNLSGGSSVSVNEVLGTIETLTGRRLDVRRTTAAQGDVFRTGGASGLAASSLGWRPRTSLVEGLAQQLDWIRAGHVGR